MTEENKKIFLSRQQTLRAIEIDLNQYETQFDLFQELCSIITGHRIIVTHQGRTDCRLLTRGKKSKTRTMTYQELGRFLMDQLRKNPPPLPVLAEICGRVFQTNCQAGQDVGTSNPGIWIGTHMASFKCRHCGNCCRNLGYHSDCTEKDYRRWEVLGREDILEKVKKIDTAVSPVYRIWVKPGTTRFYKRCPWLRPSPVSGRFECEIYNIRPDLCRQYPLTQKHAAMTGCAGVFNSEPEGLS